jgi:hypothetical protein
VSVSYPLGIAVIMGGLVGCGGSVRTTQDAGGGSRNESAAGQPTASSSVDTGGAFGEGGAQSTSGQAGGFPGVGNDSGGCTGTLDSVRAEWDAVCPGGLCAAQIWARDCASFSRPPVRRWSASTTCGNQFGPHVVVIGWSTHTKKCFYSQWSELLVGAAAEDDVASYCGQTSSSISAGTTDVGCSAEMHEDLGPCLNVTADAGSETDPETPPPECFDYFDRWCHPCCPDPLPDCEGKPDGYPYPCTLENNSYCTCACHGEQWGCAC